MLTNACTAAGDIPFASASLAFFFIFFNPQESEKVG
jgi:hypothetical protein